MVGCEVTTDDHVHEDLKGARVTILGESGGAVVKISERDPRRDMRRYMSVDRLTQASFVENSDSMTITGQSDHLGDVIGVDDPTITVRVSNWVDCENCG